MDEADAFLRKRGAEGDGQMSENMRNALSTFLYRTGSPSKKLMLVIATNEPTSIDGAILDRVDEAVEFALPGKDERVRLLEQYVTPLLFMLIQCVVAGECCVGKNHHVQTTYWITHRRTHAHPRTHTRHLQPPFDSVLFQVLPRACHHP